MLTIIFNYAPAVISPSASSNGLKLIERSFLMTAENSIVPVAPGEVLDPNCPVKEMDIKTPGPL